MISFLVPLLLCPQTCPLPIHELKAAYPFGEQLALEVTPDNKRMFVAVGAAVSVVDIASISGATILPRVIDRIELPECSPISLAYHRVAGETRRLYVAGGTMGLWKVDLCRGLFDNFNPSPCPGAGDPYARTRIDRPGNGMIWKRCVDVAVLSGNAAAGTPVLLALFAARTDSVIGGTELRAYRLGRSAPDSIDQYFTFSSFPVPAGLPPSATAVGTALAIDPADTNAVYVALGPTGICRVDLSSAQPTATAFPYFGCDLSECPFGEQVRDLAIVHTNTRGSLLYAASEYGRVHEFGPLDPTGVVIPAPVELPVPQGYPMKVSALADGDRVTLAVGTASGPGIAVDSRAPFRTTGKWFGRCAGPGTHDPNLSPPVPGSEYRIAVFSGDLSVTTTLSQVLELPTTESWNSLILRRLSSEGLRLYECTSDGGTNIHGIASPAGAAWTSNLDGEFDDIAAAAGDIAVSELNDQLLVVGVDPILAKVRHEGGMFYVQEQPQRDILPVLGTEGLCGVDARPERDSWSDPCHPNVGLSFSDPNPYLGALLGCTHWVQGDVEYFLPGAKMFARFSAQHVAINEAVWCNNDCAGNPLQPVNDWVETSMNCQDPNRVGWRLVAVRSGFTPPSAALMDMKWWQMPCPTSFPSAEVPALDYLHSEQLGDLLFCTRSGSKNALKILRKSKIVPEALAGCGTGSGVRIPVVAGTDPAQNIFIEVPTHPEFGDPQLPTCVPRIDCESTGTYVRATRHIGTYRSHAFVVRDPVSGASKSVVAVAAGFVAAGPASDQLSGCAWTSAAGRPLVTLLDVTDSVANFSPPTRRQVALGALQSTASGAPLLGSTWAVKTKTYAAGTALEKTYAFLGDLEGRLHVVDVSYDRLFGAGSGIANPIPTQCLTAHAAVELQPDPEPADGFGCNCTDVEIDGDFAYCALGRGGVGIVDISDPLAPFLACVIDTPGVAIGLAIRVDSAGHHQLVVGDTRCGLRLYGKTGE